MESSAIASLAPPALLQTSHFTTNNQNGGFLVAHVLSGHSPSCILSSCSSPQLLPLAVACGLVFGSGTYASHGRGHTSTIWAACDGEWHCSWCVGCKYRWAYTPIPRREGGTSRWCWPTTCLPGPWTMGGLVSPRARLHYGVKHPFQPLNKGDDLPEAGGVGTEHASGLLEWLWSWCWTHDAHAVWPWRRWHPVLWPSALHQMCSRGIVSILLVAHVLHEPVFVILPLSCLSQSRHTALMLHDKWPTRHQQFPSRAFISSPP